jgi:hypothetical protein
MVERRISPCGTLFGTLSGGETGRKYPLTAPALTKFTGGYSDLLCGGVTVQDPALMGALRQARVLAGATPGTLGIG